MTPKQALDVAEAMYTIHEAMSEVQDKSQRGTELFVQWTIALAAAHSISVSMHAGKTLEEAVEAALAD